MASLSKVFARSTADKCCRDLWHPNFRSCWAYNWHLWRTIAPGSFQLYVPLLVLPPLVKQDGVTWDYLVQHVRQYVGISVATYVQAAISLSAQCLFYHLCGHLHFWCIMFWPCLLGVAIGPRLPRSMLRLQAITFFNMSLEAAIRRSDHPVVRRIRRSKVAGTVGFMVLSSIILTCLQTGIVQQFWLVNPVKPTGRGRGRSHWCTHERHCLHHLADGMLKYGTIGLVLESVRALLKTAPLLLQKPRPLAVALAHFLRTCNLRLGLFLALYVGIQRAVSCGLARHRRGERLAHAPIAGLLAGIPYWLYPTYQISTLGFTKAIEMTWEYAMATGHRWTQTVPLRWLDRLPWLHLVQMFSFGYLGHVYAFYPHVSPGFHQKAMNVCSANLTLGMKRRLAAWIVGVTP